MRIVNNSMLKEHSSEFSFIINLSLYIFTCSCSSMDRTSVSGAEDGSSNLSGSTIIICYTFLAFGYLL